MACEFFEVLNLADAIHLVDDFIEYGFNFFVRLFREKRTLEFEAALMAKKLLTIEIRDVHENGIVVGSFYIADGQDVLTAAKIAEKKNKMELTLTLMRGDIGWLELSQDRKQLSGTWDRKVRRQGGSQHSRMSTLTFEKIVQGPAAIKQ